MMLQYFYAPEYATFWTSVGAIAQGFASLLGLIALIYSIRSFRKALEASHYAELDRIYAELLTKAIDKPYLRQPQAIGDPGQAMEYDTYAFMVWNFLETIVDRCEKDKALCATWYPIIDAENRIHREWFDRPQHRTKFKAEFHAFVHSSVYQQALAVTMAEQAPVAS